MTHKHLLAATLLALAASPAFAVYKCKDATGKLSYQEHPCAATGTQGGQIDATPATGHALPPAAAQTQDGQPPAAGAQPQTEAQRLRARSERNGRENRLRSLNDQVIPAAEGRVRTSSNRCTQRMNDAQGMKAYANNNLAGATWEQSLSTEMQAVATQCGAEQTRLNAELDRLHSEKTRLEQELSR